MSFERLKDLVLADLVFSKGEDTKSFFRWKRSREKKDWTITWPQEENPGPLIESFLVSV